MVDVHEVLIPRTGGERGRLFMAAVAEALKRNGHRVHTGHHYIGVGRLLYLYGVGASDRRQARAAHAALHRHTVTFDLGYFQRQRYMRVAVTRDHPQALLDITPTDSARWDSLGIALREDFDPDGPIVLVGLGRKQHRIPGITGWEEDKLRWLKKNYPGREVFYRPKPGKMQLELPLGIPVLPASMPIEEALRGKSLVVCRHSNVAVDAAVAGVPSLVEDGAAAWLQDKPFTPEVRLDFLRRVAYWQWHKEELADCLTFIFSILSRIPKP